jgi:hypothetical protein
MTLSDFRDELTFLVKGRSDTATDATRLNRIVNHAYSHLCQPETRLHKELRAVYDITLVAADYDYDLSASTVGWTVNMVKDVTYYEATAISATATKRDLRPKDLNWFNKRTISSGGNPSTYALDGELLLIYPVPSATEAGNLVRVTHWREPDPLDETNPGTSDVTVLGNYWDRVLLRGAQWLLEYDIGLRELSVLTKQEYVALINEKRDDHELNAADDSFGVEIRNERIMAS